MGHGAGAEGQLVGDPAVDLVLLQGNNSRQECRSWVLAV